MDEQSHESTQLSVEQRDHSVHMLAPCERPVRSNVTSNPLSHRQTVMLNVRQMFVQIHIPMSNCHSACWYNKHAASVPVCFEVDHRQGRCLATVECLGSHIYHALHSTPTTGTSGWQSSVMTSVFTISETGDELKACSVRPSSINCWHLAAHTSVMFALSHS